MESNMKTLLKLTLSSVGVMALAVQTVSAQNLFSTYSDFTGWSGSAGASAGPSSDWDYDGSTINGAGNNPGNTGSSINPGGSSPVGSLGITWASSAGNYNNLAFSPGEAYNKSFMHTIDPGSLAAYTDESGYGAGTTVAYSGTLSMVYTIPDNEAGSYFELGVDLAYTPNYYSVFLPSSITPLNGGLPVNGQITVEATIPYSITAGNNLQGFAFGIAYNSDYQPVLPFYVDSISVVAVPEPSSLALAALGGLCMFRVLRRRK
jgi:hypothetical protein